MARSASSFTRKNPKFAPQPTVLVLCEDRKSGKNYLEDVSRYFRVDVKVSIAHCGNTDPLGIVRKAVSEQRKYEYVFCTIDRDTHQNFDQALQLSRAHEKITVIPSYPCFEYWLLLHFGYSRKPYRGTGRLSPAEMVLKDLKEKTGMENYDKGANISIFEKLLGEPFLDARKHSPRALAEALESREMNPSTELHRLIDFLEKLSEPVELVSR